MLLIVECCYGAYGWSGAFACGVRRRQKSVVTWRRDRDEDERTEMALRARASLRRLFSGASAEGLYTGIHTLLGVIILCTDFVPQEPVAMISASSLLRCSATTGKNATISNVRPPRRPISTPAHANILWYHHHLKIYTKISHPILARRDCRGILAPHHPPINIDHSFTPARNRFMLY